MWGHRENTAFCKSGRATTPETSPAGVLILDFQPLELWDIKDAGLIPGLPQRVKDLVLPSLGCQLKLTFDPWPGNCPLTQVWLLNEKKKHTGRSFEGHGRWGPALEFSLLFFLLFLPWFPNSSFPFSPCYNLAGLQGFQFAQTLINKMLAEQRAFYFMVVLLVNYYKYKLSIVCMIYIWYAYYRNAIMYVYAKCMYTHTHTHTHTHTQVNIPISK